MFKIKNINISIAKTMMIGITLFILGIGNHASAQVFDPKYQAVFLYSFAKKIEWTSNESNFTIGVVGANERLMHELHKMASVKTINHKSIIIEKVGLNESYSQDIIFITRSHKDKLQHFLRNAGPGTLIITEFPDGARNGASINFVLQDNKMLFELNEKTTEGANFKISQSLKSLAVLVE